MFQPMKAEKLDEGFESDDYIAEVKYDGARCGVMFKDGEVFLPSGRKTDYTPIFPELQAVAGNIHAKAALVDCEVVVINDDPDQARKLIQSRVQRSNELAVRIGASQLPATLMAFDVLAINGEDLTASGHKLSLMQRKALLAELVAPSDRIQVVDFVDGTGGSLFDDCMVKGLEGTVLKRRNGLYWPGKRHPDWYKRKRVNEDSFVVCGYTYGEGWRSGLFGSLLLGEPDGNGRLRYCGSVGTGFTNEVLQEFAGDLKALETTTCPFPAIPYEPKLMSFLVPEVIVEVKFHRRTSDQMLRDPRLARRRYDQSLEELEVRG